MYRPSVINILRQFGEFNCTIVCHDDMGEMPEWRNNYTFSEEVVTEPFISEQCTLAQTQALNDYLASIIIEG